MIKKKKQNLDIYLFNKQQDESLSELKKLYFKGILSFTTILFVFETFTHNLELKNLKLTPVKKQGKIILLNKN